MKHVPQPWLVAAATRERDVREKNFPKLIEHGKITKDDAAAELVAWRAIAELMERGETERALSWSHLHLYTSRCLQALKAELDRALADPDADPARRERIGNRFALVARIHDIIDRHKFLIDDTNKLLRDRVARARAEVA